MREVIKIQSVKSKLLEKGYGYVRLTQFQERSANDVERVLEHRGATRAAIEGIVLDLRNDPRRLAHASREGLRHLPRRRA